MEKELVTCKSTIYAEYQYAKNIGQFKTTEQAILFCKLCSAQDKFGSFASYHIKQYEEGKH